MHVRHTHHLIYGWKRTDQWQPSMVKTVVSFKIVQLSGLRALKVAIYRIYGKLAQCRSCVQPACPKSGWPGSLNNNKAKSVLSHRLIPQATKKRTIWNIHFVPQDTASLNVSHANQMQSHRTSQKVNAACANNFYFNWNYFQLNRNVYWVISNKLYCVDIFCWHWALSIWRQI